MSRRQSSKSQPYPLLSHWAFARNLAVSVGLASILIISSLGVGMLGYRHFEKMPWIDAFANAAMILSGMGPLGQLNTWGGKLFAGLYAIYSGLVLIFATGLILAPIGHRVLHRFHLESQREE
jgi:hypothetical protein